MNWQVMGFGNFSSFGETDMIMRNANTGGLEVYDISNNQITGANLMGAVGLEWQVGGGTVGLDWQVAGFGPMHAGGTSDMVLRNVNTGAFLAYDISNNQITAAAGMGQVVLDWQLGGFAADLSTASMGDSSQLVQAMASFGGGAAEISNTVALATDASQQLLLTTPQ
jgi:hypothetical protein